MPLEIKPSVVDSLPTIVKSALSKMKVEEQMMFQEQYEKKSKSVAVMVAFAIIFPIQHFLLNKSGLGIVFWLSLFGFGFWYVIEWFITPKRVRDYNEDMATKIITDMKMMG